MLLFLYEYCLSIRQGYRTITFLWKFHYQRYTRYSILPRWNFEFSVNHLSPKQAQRAKNCVDVTEIKTALSVSWLISIFIWTQFSFGTIDVLSTLYLQNEAKCLHNRMASANLYRSIAYSFSSGETFKIKPPDFMWTFFPRALFLLSFYVYARQTRESDFSSLRADPLNLVYRTISTLYAIRGPAAPQARFFRRSNYVLSETDTPIHVWGDLVKKGLIAYSTITCLLLW